MITLSIFAGLLVGLLVGLTGIGGGSLMTPILLFLFGMAPGSAVGTDLIFAAGTKSAGTLVHGFNTTVNWRIVKRLSIGSLPAAGLTMWWLRTLHESKSGSADHLITMLLGIALILTSMGVLWSLWKAKHHGPQAKEVRHPQVQMCLTIVAGAAIGAMVTLTSVGAGALGMVALVWLYPEEEGARLVGSDIAHAVPLTLLAGLGHSTIGNVEWTRVLWLLAGSIPGIAVGSYLAARLPRDWLRILLAVVLMGVGLKYAM